MEYCAICGHAISDNNTTGIGCECMHAVNYIVKCNISKDKKVFFDLWNTRVMVYKEIFIDVYKDTKFRSEFKKSFYDTIKKAERISKKQLDIIKDMLQSKDVLTRANTIADNAYRAKYDSIFHRMAANLTREDIEKARQIIRGKTNKA